MACREWTEELVAVLYGEADPADERRAREHVATCASCREDLDGLAEIRRDLQAYAPPIPAAPRVILLAPRSGRWLVPALAASLAAVGLVAGLAASWAWQARDKATWAAAKQPVPAATPASASPSRDEIDRWVDARVRELLAVSHAAPARTTDVHEAVPVTRSELEQRLARLERRVDRGRASDVQYVLGELAGVEVRTGVQLGEAQQAIRYLARANDPSLNEQ